MRKRAKRVSLKKARRVQFSKTYIRQNKKVPFLRGGRRAF